MIKKFMIVFIIVLTFVGCSKTENITFTATIDQVNENSILVSTIDFDDFDIANVDLREAEVEFQVMDGQLVEITILPLVRESYPVQVTGVKVKLMALEPEGEKEVAYKKITAEEAMNMMNDNDLVILDVRTLEEFKDKHIQGALNIPSTNLSEEAAEKLPDKDAAIIVYCHSGVRSASAAKWLIEEGYSNVYDLGGIADWPYETISE